MNNRMICQIGDIDKEIEDRLKLINNADWYYYRMETDTEELMLDMEFYNEIWVVRKWDN